MNNNNKYAKDGSRYLVDAEYILISVYRVYTGLRGPTPGAKS